MIEPEQHAEIRRLFFAEHWKVNTIAMQLGVHHESVERALETHRFASAGRYRKSQLEPYLDFIRETLEQYPLLRATRVHEMITGRGYAGSEVQTRRAVRRLRPVSRAEAFLRRRTLQGEEGQVDWGHFGRVQIGRARRPLSAFVMCLSWSRGMDVTFTVDQVLETFLRGHVNAFEYFRGCPRTILYDNLKSAVLERYGTAVRFQPRLLEFAAYYHFRPQPVAVARGNEKGRVERLIRFLRDRFFAARTFCDVDDLNAQFRSWRDTWAHARRNPEDEMVTVREALERERDALLPLPEHGFCTDRLVTLRSGKTPYLRFDLNDYSIPHTLVQKPLTLVASLETVRILDGELEVARHPRSWNRHERIETEAHIEALVREKRAARESRGKSRLTQAVPAATAFLEAVVLRGHNLGATTSQLIRLLDDYGAAELSEAVQEALDRHTPTAVSVALLLEQGRRRRRQRPPVRVELPADPRVRDLRVTPHNLETYDALNRIDHA